MKVWDGDKTECKCKKALVQPIVKAAKTSENSNKIEPEPEPENMLEHTRWKTMDKDEADIGLYVWGKLNKEHLGTTKGQGCRQGCSKGGAGKQKQNMLRDVERSENLQVYGRGRVGCYRRRIKSREMDEPRILTLAPLDNERTHLPITVYVAPHIHTKYHSCIHYAARHLGGPLNDITYATCFQSLQPPPQPISVYHFAFLY